MKRILSVMILCFLVLSLFGCNTVPDVTTTEPQSTEPQSTEPQNTLPPNNISDADDYTILYLPAQVENPDNLPVLKWAAPTSSRVILSLSGIVPC